MKAMIKPKPAIAVLLAVALLATGMALYANRVLRWPSFLPLSQEDKDLYQQAKKLIPLHQPLGEIQAGDWLESHTEWGQTFSEYAKSHHIRLTDERNILYVLPLGEFDEKQKKIVELSSEFLSLYFMCEVKTLETKGLEVIPEKARRVHPTWGMRQINSKYVLDDLLKPLLPDDGVALIAFSSSDLYPQDDWNFVFGQASLQSRVGVWSLYRNGDPETEFTTVLRRTLQTATHETGHMFSIQHCIAYECNMCGSNNREESDRRPLVMCPECVGKVWLATECDPKARFQKLQKFCQENELIKEAEYYGQSIKLLDE